MINLIFESTKNFFFQYIFFNGYILLKVLFFSATYISNHLTNNATYLKAIITKMTVNKHVPVIT